MHVRPHDSAYKAERHTVSHASLPLRTAPPRPHILQITSCHQNVINIFPPQLWQLNNAWQTARFSAESWQVPCSVGRWLPVCCPSWATVASGSYTPGIRMPGKTWSWTSQGSRWNAAPSSTTLRPTSPFLPAVAELVVRMSQTCKKQEKCTKTRVCLSCFHFPL